MKKSNRFFPAKWQLFFVLPFLLAFFLTPINAQERSAEDAAAAAYEYDRGNCDANVVTIKSGFVIFENFFSYEAWSLEDPSPTGHTTTKKADCLCMLEGDALLNGCGDTQGNVMLRAALLSNASPDSADVIEIEDPLVDQADPLTREVEDPDQ